MRRMRKLTEELREMKKRDAKDGEEVSPGYHLRKSSNLGSVSPASTYEKRQEVVKREVSPKVREKKGYPWFNCDLTQLKTAIRKRSPERKIRTMIEFFNGQKEDPAEKNGRFVALKRSLSSRSIGHPHLTSTTREEIGARSGSTGRLRRVCFSTVDLPHVEDDEVPLTDESPDYGSDYEEVSADEQEVGCAIPDVKGLINMFSEL